MILFLNLVSKLYIEIKKNISTYKLQLISILQAINIDKPVLNKMRYKELYCDTRYYKKI
jgi:hypothetical protein